MRESYTQLFDEQDLLEENNYQWVYTGKEKKAPHHKVLIHKFKKSDQYNEGFKELIDTLQNKCYIDETEDAIVLVTKDLEGDNISLHLNFSSVTTEERLDYLYDYLHQAVAYIGFDPYLFNTLISSNQLVFIDNKLYLREKIVLDRKINADLPFTMVAKNLGQVMQRILITNYNELRTSIKYDHLYSFTEALIRREKDYLCFDDLFNEFKAIYFGKSSTKKQVLLGENHPNNIFLESTDTQEEALPEVSLEVTEEERALLTGFTYKQTEGPKPTEQAEVFEEPSPVDYGENGPVEESLDLSKLTDGDQSLEDLIVRKTVAKAPTKKVEVKKDLKKHKKTYTPPLETTQVKVVHPLEEDTLSDTSDLEEPVTLMPEDNAPRLEEEIHKEDEPQIGLPAYMKEDKLAAPVPLRPKSKFSLHWSIPLIFILVLLFIGGTIFGVMKIINKPEGVDQPPIAKFEARFEGNSLKCTNLSQAFNGARIVESLWDISKDGVAVNQEPGANNAGLSVTSLTEGLYTITLTVTDSNGQFSDPSTINREYLSAESKALENKTLSESVYLEKMSATPGAATSYELFDDFTISTSDNAMVNTEKYKSGQYAYMIDTREAYASVSFNGLNVKPGSSLSFWILSDSDQPVEMQISGFKNGVSNFEKTMVAKTNAPYEWKVASLQLSIDTPTDNIIFRFPQDQGTVWFDDLSIRTFK